jgi:hypothetical protein
VRCAVDTLSLRPIAVGQMYCDGLSEDELATDQSAIARVREYVVEVADERF